MDFGGLSQALHVVFGDTPLHLLQDALHLTRDRVLMNEDPLSCGPTPATDDLGVWRSTRESFIRDLYVGWPDFSFDAYTDNGLLMNAQRLGREDSVIVWVALGLPDQLLLAWVVSLCDRLGEDTSKISVVQFEKAHAGYPVFSVGVLSVENIRNPSPGPRHLTSQEVEELRRAWSVYTSSDPKTLSDYATEPCAMPVLHRALRQVLYRYPDIRSGLSVWDERLLRDTEKQGPSTLRVIGHTLGTNETPDQVCDSYLFRRLMALGDPDLASPLLSIAGNAGNMHECEVTLTAFGRKVLAGEANHVRENGIDDWVGGVHLGTEGPVTYRDGDSLVFPD